MQPLRLGSLRTLRFRSASVLEYVVTIFHAECRFRNCSSGRIAVRRRSTLLEAVPDRTLETLSSLLLVFYFSCSGLHLATFSKGRFQPLSKALDADGTGCVDFPHPGCIRTI